MIPSLSVTKPTPIKQSTQSHRLLYNGSLIISDQYTEIPLQGICFVAHLPPASPTSFLNSPLPLALESMHGRPSLKITSIITYSSVQGRLDDSVDIRLYWHPLAYHANEFFLRTIWALGGCDQNGHSIQCVKIRLGDTEDPEETEMVVYGERSQHSNSQIRFHVARLLQVVPQRLHPRPPRPDDPLPRRIPILLKSPGRQGRKRPSSPNGEKNKERQRKRGKILADTRQLYPQVRSKSSGMLSFGNPSLLQAQQQRSRSSSFRSSSSRGFERAWSFTSSLGDVIEDDVFKVPSNPVRSTEDQDTQPSTTNGSTSEAEAVPFPTAEKSELEINNKTLIKKLALPVLAARGISREHSDFKELFGWITRGVGFAMRRSMNVQRLERELVKTLIIKHVEMYVNEPSIA